MGYKDSMIRPQILKKASQNPKYRRALIRKLGGRYTKDYEDVIVQAKNDGRYYRRRDAKGAVFSSMQEQAIALPGYLVTKAIKEIQDIWKSEDEDPNL